MPNSLPNEQPIEGRRSVAFMTTHPSGGIRELWANLAEGLGTRGFAVSCVALYPPRWNEAGGGGMPWRHLVDGPLGNPLRAAKLVIALTRWLRTERPKLVVTAMPAANVIVPLVARFASPGTRVAISHHSPAETHSRVLSALDSRTGQLANVSAIISVSHAVEAS